MLTGQNPEKDANALKHPPVSWGTIAILVAAVAALLLSLLLIDTPGQRQMPSQASSGKTAAKVIEVEAKGMAFSPSVITVEPNQPLQIKVTNADPMVHDLTLASGETTGAIAPGETKTLTVPPLNQSLEGWCSVPGHRQMGMVFEIKVEGGEKPQASGHDHGQMSQPARAEAPAAAEFLAKPTTTLVDPLAPKPSGGKLHKVQMRVTEVELDMGGGFKRPVWTFNGGPVGPTLRGKVGDEFEVTLINDGTMDHSIDFHASWLSPNEAMKSIPPGASHVYRFRAHRSGIWLYHCSTSPMSLHIAAGMHGAVIIDPADMDPVDKEFVFVQSEIYPSKDGAPDYAAIDAVQPLKMSFNGVPYQYRAHPIKVRVGERIRAWVLAAGPSLGTSFHVVGSQFETVWSEGTYSVRNNRPVAGGADTTGAQVLPLTAAQGGFVEFVLPEPGDYAFVDHHMVRAEQGAVGIFHAE